MVGGIGFWAASTTKALAKVIESTTRKHDLAASIALALEKERVAGRDVLLGQDATNLLAARAQFQQGMDTLEPLLTSETSHRLFSEVQQDHIPFAKMGDDSFKIHQSGDDAAARESFYGVKNMKIRNDIKTATTDLTVWFGKQAADALAEQAVASERASTLILLFVAIGLVVGITISVIAIRSLIASITPIVYVLSEISKNNFCIPDLEIPVQDELGAASLAVNNMKISLGSMVRQITSSAEQLAAATQEIAMTARESADSSDTQAAQASQVASAMEEISATVREVSSNARQAAEASSQSVRAAVHGGKIAEETLQSMKSIAASTGNAAARILELGKSSEQIGNIVAVITDIAGQTNLLALNAAIEAARAGEQGRGFAVVAGEVRRLAERTSTATQEISAMIETIQKGTRVAVEAIEQGSREVEIGVAKTSTSGESLNEIIRLSEEAGTMVAHIASASSQQQDATDLVNRSISEISTLTRGASTSARDTADASNSLAKLATDMQHIVSTFCVEDGTSNRKPSRRS
jgi:methyl-accepting chemotaxis protein